MGAAVLHLALGLRITNLTISRLETELGEQLDSHPDTPILRSLPGVGTVLAGRMLSEFGDDRDRFADAASRRHYAGTAPVTKASGKAKGDAGMFHVLGGLGALGRPTPTTSCSSKDARTGIKHGIRCVPRSKPNRQDPPPDPHPRHQQRPHRRHYPAPVQAAVLSEPQSGSRLGSAPDHRQALTTTLLHAHGTSRGLSGKRWNWLV